MSEQQKTTLNDTGTSGPSPSACCPDMTEKMLGQQVNGGCAETMAKMMATCCEGTADKADPGAASTADCGEGACSDDDGAGPGAGCCG